MYAYMPIYVYSYITNCVRAQLALSPPKYTYMYKYVARELRVFENSSLCI